jgi:hypothetical protein
MSLFPLPTLIRERHLPLFEEMMPEIRAALGLQTADNFDSLFLS